MSDSSRKQANLNSGVELIIMQQHSASLMPHEDRPIAGTATAMLVEEGKEGKVMPSKNL